jgi:aspartate kinase
MCPSARTLIQPQPSRLRPTVMKFGGSSVANTEGFERVQQIVREYRDSRPVVVVSAMSRVTDSLLESVRATQSGEVAIAEKIVEEISSRHLTVARDLLTIVYEASVREITGARDEISALLREAAANSSPSLALEDLIVSYGERLSAGLLAAILLENELPAKYVDARRCIITDNEHRHADPLPERSRQQTRAELETLIELSIIPVLGGFIGMSEEGETTTLGRNGSDYTASIVGSALDAREIQIWSDVSGVLTSDPQIVRAARTVSQLSYEEAADLASFGARVLHSKMIQPAAEQSIPVSVRNSLDRRGSKTLICSERGQSASRIKAMAHRIDMTVLQTTSLQLISTDPCFSLLLGTLKRSRVEIYGVAASTTSAAFIVRGGDLSPELVKELNEIMGVNIIEKCAGLYIIGESLSSIPDILKQLVEAVDGSDSSLVLQSTFDNNLVLAVAGGRIDEIVTRLHSIFVEEE